MTSPPNTSPGTNPGSNDVQRAVSRLNPTKMAASAAGAVLAAVVLSKFGVAGTLTGAALGSVVSTVGTEVNEHYLSRSSRRLQELRAAQRRSGRARPGTAEAPGAAGTAEAPGTAGAAGADASEPSVSPGWQRPAWMSWKALAALGVGGFLIAMLAITGFELAVGKPLAGVVGNQVSSGRSTTFGEVARGDGGQERSTTPTPSVGTDSTSPTAGSTVPGSTVPGSTATTVPATSTTAPGLQQSPATTAPPSATTRPAGG
jgi:hypothetical protein